MAFTYIKMIGDTNKGCFRYGLGNLGSSDHKWNHDYLSGIWPTSSLGQ